MLRAPRPMKAGALFSGLRDAERRGGKTEAAEMAE
jgi:hypothetical protein